MLVLIARRSAGFSTRLWSSGRRSLAQTATQLSSDRRLSEWDAIFDQPSDNSSDAEPSARVTPKAGSSIRYESTDDEFGGYDFDPSMQDFPEVDMSMYGAEDDAPPQSAAWDDDAPPQSAAWDEEGPAKILTTPKKTASVPAPRTTRAQKVVAIPQTEAAPPVPSVVEPLLIDSSSEVTREEMQVPAGRKDLYTKTSNGGGMDVSVERLEERLKELEQTIYKQNNGEEFNINSPKQVSVAVFGTPDQSTNKNALEAVGAAGNALADMVLEYRQRKAEIKRVVRKEKSVATGTQVTSFSKTESADGDNDPLILVDASAYIFRAYYSMPPIHRGDGMPTGAVMGFCNMLNRLMLTRALEGDCPRLVLVFDAKGKNFRHDLYEDYKANRPDCPIDLVPQFDLIHEAAKAYGIPEIEAAGFEADDVIATLATDAIQAGIDTHILSGDKDLMQLVTPPDMMPYVHMVDPTGMSRTDHNAVVEKWGVPPDLIGDILALAGDSADNIPGVPGIGPKTAASLLEEYGSLTELLDQLESIKQKGRREKLMDNKDLAILSRELVELERAIPFDRMLAVPASTTNVSDLRMEPLDGDRLLAFYDSMGFREIKRRVKDRLTQRDRKATTTTTTPRPKKKKSYRRAKVNVPKPEDYEDVPF